jgi:endonuclease/exonuclease/phosphatase family metal-dependent hydrolase
MSVFVRFRAHAPAAAALFACAVLAACASHPEQMALPQPAAKPARIEVDAKSGVATAEISVMTYNVAGLPWPIKKGRGKALKEIAKEVEALHAAGSAPDIIVLQEAFSPASAQIGEAYPNRLRGPRSGDRTTTDAPPLGKEFKKARNRRKGERMGKVFSSGLYLFSNYPIVDAHMTPFRRSSCAGYDCLANKGAMIAVVDIPGAPTPVQILNTHLNSNGRSGVKHERALAAHKQQVDEIGDLLSRLLNKDWPLIYAGDFNTRNAEERFEHNAETLPGELVMQYCLAESARCDARMSWDGDEPWLDTQDLQGFSDGAKVEVRPVRAEAMFDKPVNGRKLSDHDAYTVTYRLTWRLNGAGDRNKNFTGN